MTVIPYKKHIVFMVHELAIGGMQMVLLQNLVQLRKNPGLKLTVIVGTPVTHELFADFFKQYPDINLVVVPSFALKRPRRGFIARNIWRLNRFLYNKLLRHQYYNVTDYADLVIDYTHFHTYPVKLKPGRLVPYVAFYHSGYLQFVKDDEYKNAHRYTKIIVLSESFAIDIREKYPKLADKVDWIYNPIDIDKIIDSANAAQSAPGGKYFVVAARMHWHKDNETAIRAFNKFYETEKPDCKLYLIGDGDMRAYWQDLANSLPARDNIIFTGEMSNPYGYIRDASALVMSSYSEGLPFVLCEAMALDTLCIASNCKSGVNEIMCGGQGGLMFEPGNVDELAARMSDVYNGRGDFDKMRRVAKEGLARFAPEKIANQVLGLL